MRSSIYQKKYQLFIPLLPDKKPIGLNVAFPISLKFAGKFMSFIFRWKSFSLFKNSQNLPKFFDIQTSLKAFLKRLFKLIGIDNTIGHIPRIC